MAAVDLTPLATGVDFSSTVVAVVAVASVLVGVVVTLVAVFFVIGLVRGQTFYKGRWWDNDVYEIALRDVKAQARRGALVDAGSRAAINRFEGRSKGRK